MIWTEAMFRAIFEGLHDAVVVTDPQRRIRLVNPAFTTVFGYAADEAIGRGTDFLYFDAADHQRVGLERLEPASAGTASTERYRRRDGSVLWAETVGLRVTAAGGELIGFMGLVRDITDRKREQDQLRLSEALFETAFANNPAAIALTRLDDGTISNVNESWLAMTGETRESIIGSSARFMWPSVEEAARFVANLRAHGRLHGWEQTFLRRNGETFEAQISSQVLKMQGEPVVLSTLVDITQRKRVERELKELAATLEQRVEQRTAELAAARDEAKGASRAKSSFLANMSHEIRTPMNAIIGLTHIMLRSGADGVERERLGKVHEAAQHLLQIINGILDLSKIDAGKFELEEVPFDLGAALERAVGLIDAAARGKGLEVVVDTDDLPRTLRGDSTRLTQALVNLLANAVKFTSRGAVTLRCHVLGEEEGRLVIHFAVHDTGPGIPADRLGRLFEAFEQADSSTTRQFGGTGLGLAITRRIAETMGGTAGVESELGTGSTFWFTVKMPAVDAASVPAHDDTLLYGLRALVVDDLPEARAALEHMLRRFGVETESAESGEQGLQLAAAAALEGRPFDVWVIDWLMPRMDGIETVRRLREQEGEATPAILVSAADDVHDRAWAAGMRVLIKPVSASALHEQLLRDVLQRRFAESSVGALAKSSVGAPTDAPVQLHSGVRVLLAEDNPVNQEVAGELLRMVGIEVEIAGTGSAAVEMAMRGGYDLILMDMQMPEMDGADATRAIRKVPGMAALPIIAMTANAFAEDRAECLAAGMNDHIGKPVSPRELYRLIEKWLGS